MKRTAAAVPSAGPALEAFDRLVKVSDKKEFQTRCFIVDVAHGPMMMWLCKDDYLPIQAQDGQLGNSSKRGWVGFVCFVLDFVNQDHILKHGRVIGSDLRPPSVTGMAKPAVQRLLRANRDPLSQVRQHLHSLSHADTHFIFRIRMLMLFSLRFAAPGLCRVCARSHPAESAAGTGGVLRSLQRDR